MSNISVDYDVLNQRGSPAWFTDTFANIPTAGYVGRMFISKDTFAFYRDTGTGWDLIGGPGIGTLTGSGVVGQVSFFNGTQVLAGNNNLFWDNTNSRLGINTTTPGQPLDIHSTGNTLVQLNNTTTANSNISFQNQNVAKWRVGNVYNAGANSFNIENAVLLTNALTISSTTNNITLTGGLTATGVIANNFYGVGNGVQGAYIYLKQGTTPYAGLLGSNGISADGTKFLLIANVDASNNKIALFELGSLTNNTNRTYTLPDTTGTLALTSDLTSYLPLTGGTLTGQLYINPTNTLTIGLDVASNTTRFRSDNLEGFKRQLEITMGSGTLVQCVVKGFGGTYGTDLAFYTSSASGVNVNPAMYITGGNQIGLGNGTPTTTLDVSGTGRFTGAVTLGTDFAQLLPLTAANYQQLIGCYYNGTNIIATNTTGSRSVYNVGGFTFNTFSGATIGGIVTDTERFQIQNSGNIYMSTTPQLFVGTTLGLGGRIVVQNNNTTGIDLFDGTNNNDMMLFFNASVVLVGSITLIGGVSTSYNTTSDYRLKEDLKEVNGLDKILSMKIYNYKWKDNNLRMEGVLAHELAEIVPYAVTGEKDAKNMQGVDYSKLVPILIKSIQELNEKLIRNNIN